MTQRLLNILVRLCYQPAWAWYRCQLTDPAHELEIDTQ
jgi:hypothetical protein